MAFANVLVFVQLGIMNSMAIATLKPYGFFAADIMISASDANSMTEGGNVARQWMFQALEDPDVTAGTGLFVGNISWQRPEKTLGLTTYGIDPTLAGFFAPTLRPRPARCNCRTRASLTASAAACRRKRPPQSARKRPLTFEVSGKTLTLYDTFAGRRRLRRRRLS